MVAEEQRSLEATKKRPLGPPTASATATCEKALQSGWKSKSGKKRLNSIMMPAVMANQMVAKTGAVVRNFFMRGWKKRREGLDGRIDPPLRCSGALAGMGVSQRGETVTLLSASVSLPPLNSAKAARGQEAAARVHLKARGASIWISFMAASLRPRTAWM